MSQNAIPFVTAAQEAWALQYHFSPGLLVGDTVYVSGQLGTDDSGTPLADPEAQYVGAFENVKDVLVLADCGLEDVVELMSFHSDFDTFDLFTEVKDRYLTGPVYPTWTTLGTNLTLPGALVEIKCTAIRKGGAAR